MKQKKEIRIGQHKERKKKSQWEKNIRSVYSYRGTYVYKQKNPIKIPHWKPQYIHKGSIRLTNALKKN